MKIRARIDGTAHARVDGGYTQKDVTEVARCFTGWTVDKPRQYADFKFDERLHDRPEACARKKDPRRRHEDGEQVIELLVHHPSTAKFISTKLARRFVSDNPSPTLVNRMRRLSNPAMVTFAR